MGPLREVDEPGASRAADPRFATRDARTVNAHALHEIVAKIYATKPTAYWVELLVKAGIPASPVNTVGQMIADKQVIAREMIVEQQHPISWQGRDWVFASALLFHQDSLHLTALPRLRFGYPQLNVRVYVLDDEGIPSVLFRRMLMPAWVAPGVRLITHQPASRARLQLPAPLARRRRRPVAMAAPSGRGRWRCGPGRTRPAVGEGPRLGSWEESVRYFQERPRGYALASGSLQRISAQHPAVPIWPLRAEVRGDGLLPRLLDLPAGTPWPGLHSAWLCPEIPFVFELGSGAAGAGRRRRHAAAGGGTGGELPLAAGRPAAAGAASPLPSGGGPRASIRCMNPTPPSERRPQRIAVLPGDGSGKDVTAEAVKVLEAAAEAWEPPPGAGPSRLGRRPLSGDRRDPARGRLRRLPRQLRRRSSSAPSAIPGCRT